jgi:hypothetical protein
MDILSGKSLKLQNALAQRPARRNHDAHIKAGVRAEMMGRSYSLKLSTGDIQGVRRSVRSALDLPLA